MKIFSKFFRNCSGIGHYVSLGFVLIFQNPLSKYPAGRLELSKTTVLQDDQRDRRLNIFTQRFQLIVLKRGCCWFRKKVATTFNICNKRNIFNKSHCLYKQVFLRVDKISIFQNTTYFWKTLYSKRRICKFMVLDTLIDYIIWNKTLQIYTDNAKSLWLLG